MAGAPVDVLQQVPLFAELGQNELESVARLFKKRHFSEGETVLSVRVTDMLGMPHAEGGYRGWDIPSIGRMVFFRVIQEY